MMLKIILKILQISLLCCFFCLIFSLSQAFGQAIIMPLGDSITYGYVGPPENPDDIIGYRQSLWESLDNNNYDIDFVGSQVAGGNAIPVFDTHHEGHSGYRSDEIENYIHGYLTDPNYIDEDNPVNLVLLHIGTNDLNGTGLDDPVEVSTIKENIIDILNVIDGVSRDIVVILAQIIDFVPTNPEVTQLNNEIASIVASRQATGDKIYLVNQFNALDYENDMTDELHPNQSGYEKMANTWFASLDNLLHVYTPENATNGTIDPATPQTVVAGNQFNFIITPDDGYHVASVTGCDGNLFGDTYTTADTITGDCSLIAEFDANDTIYMVTPSAGEHGSITPSSPQGIEYGSSTSFTITPDTGYHNASVSGCDGNLLNDIYTTGTIIGDCSVTAVFEKNSYTVTPSAEEYGSIVPSSPQSVEHGLATSFIITPDNGYHISLVSGCGGSLNGNIYTTDIITGDCDVNAEFSDNNTIYTVTPFAGKHGQVTPSAPQGIVYGQTTSFTVTPDNGYYIASINGCQGNLSGNIFTTGPITSDCNISVNFCNRNCQMVIIPILQLLLK